MKIKNLISIIFLLLALAACAPTTNEGNTTITQPAADLEEAKPTPVNSEAYPIRPEPAVEVKGDTIISEAALQGMQVLSLEPSPAQVTVQVSGYLPDGCTSFGPVHIERVENTFHVTVQTSRPADRMCTQQVSNFEESILLDVAGLPAGTYTVDVNGLTDTFELGE